MGLLFLTPCGAASLMVTLCLMTTFVTGLDLKTCNGEKCGSGTGCINGKCTCKPGFVDLKNISKTPGGKYCLKKCTTNKDCSVNTTCSREGPKQRCYCEQCFQRDANGECWEDKACMSQTKSGNGGLDRKSGHDRRETQTQTTDRQDTEHESSQLQTIASAGGSVLLVFIAVLIITVVSRKRLLKKKNTDNPLESEDQENDDGYTTIATDNSAVVTHLRPAKTDATGSLCPPDDVSKSDNIRVGQPSANQYELVDEVYSMCNITNADDFSSELYSNRTIPENKMKEKASRKVTQEGNINHNDYSTLYSGNARWTNEKSVSIQPRSTGNFKSKSDGADNVVNGSSECEYDHLGLQKV